MEVNIMKTSGNLSKKIAVLALATAFLLSIPLVAMQFTREVDWGPVDFMVMGTLIFGTGLAYILITRKANHITYRFAAGMALATAFLLIWANLAVGLIGAGPNPGNLMYMGVLAVGIIGTFLSNFKPSGMQRTMLATVLSLVLLTATALIMGMQHYPGSSVIEILGVNGLFIFLFTLAALLFRSASQRHNESGTEQAG